MKKILKSKKGVALAMVIIIFAVVAIVGTTVLTISLSQTTISKASENTTAAYYYARSAVEIVSSNIEDKYEELNAMQAHIETSISAAEEDDGIVDEEEYADIEPYVIELNEAQEEFDDLQLIPATISKTCAAQVGGILANPLTVLINLVSSGGSDVIELSCTVTYEGNTSSARAQIGTFTQGTATVEYSSTSTDYGPFGYGVFSDSSITTGVNQLTINGDVHTNGSYTSNANNQTYNGSVEAVTSYSSSSNKLTITGTCMAPTISASGNQVTIANSVYSAADVIAMPDFSDSLDEVIATPDGTWQHYTGDKQYNGSKTTVDTPLYVEGNLQFNANNTAVNAPLYVEGNLQFNGNGITVNAPIYVGGNITIQPNNFTTTSVVVATGNITISTNNLNSIWFYSTNGNITVGANNLDMEGLLYAPNGTIGINVNTMELAGRIVGKVLQFNANTITINTSPDDLDVLSEIVVTTTSESVSFTVYTPAYDRVWLR